MKRASGVGHLTPFLPGLGALLEDPEVSEIMINGPTNVWVEREGKLEPHEAPGLTAAWLHRAAIHIARPLGLDPAANPILDARLEDGSRVAICTPPASPEVAITIRRFGGRAFSAEDLVRLGSLPEDILEAARNTLAARQNILVSGGTGSRSSCTWPAAAAGGSSRTRSRYAATTRSPATGSPRRPERSPGRNRREEPTSTHRRR